MGQDFGSRAAPVWRRGQRLAFLWSRLTQAGLVAGLLMFASLPTSIALSMRGGGGGPPPPVGAPCRPIDRARFERGWAKPAHSFSFYGAAYARRTGDVFCYVLRDGLFGPRHAVCEFTTPTELAVTVGGRTSYFDIGPGLTVVTDVRADGPHCVVAGRFRL